MAIKKCRTCKNAIFDDVWGQYKCKRLAHNIDDADRYTTCKYYDQNPDAEPVVTKRWEVK